VSIGVMQKGSIVVNGVHFEDNTAQIKIDDTLKTPADLRSGMLVKVRGQINDDRVTGTAQFVKVESEVRGTVQTHNSTAVPPSFTVVGQTVFVDDLTVFANFSTATPSPAAAVGELRDGGSIVEVHGLRDGAGNIHASRVELLNGNLLGDELRGTIKPGSLTLTTFTLQNGTAEVHVSYTAISPAGATLANGMLVEVHGSFNGTTFVATRVDIEDLKDAQFQHAAGEEFEIEGQVIGCAATPCTSFNVGNQAVLVNGNTRFENGTATDIANNVRLEAEGHQFSGTTLIAEKIIFKRTRVILTGQVTATNGPIPGTGTTITVLGQVVHLTALTEVRQQGGITTADRVEVRGFVDSTRQIVAERVDGSAGGTRDIVQAGVTSKNVSTNVLTFLSDMNADLTNTTQFRGAPNRDAFLAAIVPAPLPAGGTLVKVKGTFNSNANTIAVEEAELEN
jgi:cytochrome c-type biogenesis protein CcmE